MMKRTQLAAGAALVAASVLLSGCGHATKPASGNGNSSGKPERNPHVIYADQLPRQDRDKFAAAIVAAMDTWDTTTDKTSETPVTRIAAATAPPMSKWAATDMDKNPQSGLWASLKPLHGYSVAKSQVLPSYDHETGKLPPGHQNVRVVVTWDWITTSGHVDQDKAEYWDLDVVKKDGKWYLSKFATTPAPRDQTPL